jgi:hypothetical protein
MTLPPHPLEIAMRPLSELTELKQLLGEVSKTVAAMRFDARADGSIDPIVTDSRYDCRALNAELEVLQRIVREIQAILIVENKRLQDRSLTRLKLGE